MPTPIGSTGGARPGLPTAPAAATPAVAFSARLAAAGVLAPSAAAAAPSLGRQVITAATGHSPGGGFAGAVASQYGTDSAAQLAAMLRVQVAVQKENQWFTTISNAEKALSTKPIYDNLK